MKRRRRIDLRREVCPHHDECKLSTDRLPCGYEIAGCVAHCAENRRRNEGDVGKAAAND
jgi:hypothetical protein